MKGQKRQSYALLFVRLILLVTLVGGTWGTAAAAGISPAPDTARSTWTVPTFEVTAVDPDKTITIRTANFPANDTFQILMGKIGTRGVGGTVIGTLNSGAGGTFTTTLNIPAGLKGLERIAVRLQSPTSGYFSYNWFWNTSGGIPVTGPTPKPIVTPTFTITEVVKDTSVKITTANFPANDTFDVLMNYMGTRGVGGIKVATVNSGAGGVFAATFNIPAGLKGQERIAIRLQSPTSGYFSYNWFWNNTGGGSIPVTGPTPKPFVTPTFTITGVTRDASVTVQTANFPANDTFTVTMGAYGTRGQGGIAVGTFASNAGGSLAATFTIPAALKGYDRIAIRMQSPTSGYYSYNWFWNNTYP
jgi:hypothetical protein